MTINCEGAVARVATFLSTAVLSMLPMKMKGGETWKMELSYVVAPVTLVEV